MILTILEGHITHEKWSTFEIAFRTEMKHFPTHLRETILIQDTTDKTLWRVISIWRSEQDYEQAMQNTDHDTNAVNIYHAVGIEPTRRVFKAVAHHQYV
jgi:hypothetical protein